MTPLGRERLNFAVAERYDLSVRKCWRFSLAPKSDSFSGVSLRGWMANEGFVSLLQTKAQRGVKCRILVMGYDNPAVSQMLNRRIENQEERLRRNIK